MKTTWINPRLALYTALSALGIAFGCSGQEDHGTSASSTSSSSATSTSASSTGSGGAGGGESCPCGEGSCTWSGVGGGISIPVCEHGHVSAFDGTIDGKAYNERFAYSYTSISDWEDPATLTLQFDLNLPVSYGQLTLEWTRPTMDGQFKSVTGGALKLPTENVPRAVMSGSQFRIKCSEGLYQYILTVEGGQLNGCSGD